MHLHAYILCVYTVYTWLYIYMFIIYSGISTCREERPSAWHHQGAPYDPKRPAGIAQWQKPRTARSSKSVPIYWPPKKFGWIFSIEAQTTGMRTWLDVLTVGKNSMEGRVGLFFSKTRVALPVELEKLKLKTKLDDYAGDLLRSTWALHCQTGSGYCQSTWRVRGRSGWILWHLVLDHPQEWCMWDDLPLEGVEWVWQVCPSVGGSLMGAGYSGWGPWWLIHQPWGYHASNVPKESRFAEKQRVPQILEDSLWLPETVPTVMESDDWMEAMFASEYPKDSQASDILPIRLGVYYGKCMGKRVPLFGSPCNFPLFWWIMELMTTAATLDPDLDQWQFMCLWLVVLVRMYTVFVVLWRVWRLHKKYKFKLSICLGFRVNHSGFQAELDPQAHLSSLISIYPNLQRCYHHSSNRYSHLWMAQEPHSAINHHLNHDSAIPMQDCLTH